MKVFHNNREGRMLKPSEKNRQKSSLKQCVFINSPSKYSTILLKIHSDTDFFGDFAHLE